MSKVLSIKASQFDRQWQTLEPETAKIFIQGDYTHVSYQGVLYQCIIDHAALLPKADDTKIVYINAEVGTCKQCHAALFVDLTSDSVVTRYECRGCDQKP
ncbi:hypothetical protein [Vibrio agarivorans]|uniref:hypothetical protein n=1 Tax=Vibrio agarivorans TaxID=153622 RepID=UPI0025B5C28B|nr:hypothetical protein [Vibrio agarivorans]MDN3661045.1 hypothetical protein [Vibrio agarivorans]